MENAHEFASGEGPKKIATLAGYFSAIGSVFFLFAFWYSIAEDPTKGWLFFRAAAYIGLPISVLTVVAGLFRTDIGGKRKSLGVGALMTIVWVILTLLSIPKS